MVICHSYVSLLVYQRVYMPYPSTNPFQCPPDSTRQSLRFSTSSAAAAAATSGRRSAAASWQSCCRRKHNRRLQGPRGSPAPVEDLADASIYIYTYELPSKSFTSEYSCYCYGYRFWGGPIVFQGFVEISIFEIQHEAKIHC